MHALLTYAAAPTGKDGKGSHGKVALTPGFTVVNSDLDRLKP